MEKEEKRLRKKTEDLLRQIGFVISRPQGFALQRLGYEVMVYTGIVFISYKTNLQDTSDQRKQIQREMLIRCHEVLLQLDFKSVYYEESEEPYICLDLPITF